MALAKYAVQTLTRMPHEKVPLGALLRAGLLYDATPLEPLWKNGHLGFNQVKLERLLRERFRILHRRSLPATLLWLIARR